MVPAVAVADAGGVGRITTLGLAPAELDQVLARMTARTSGVLAANFLTGQADPEAVAVAAARVRIVDFFWADPDPALVDGDHRRVPGLPAVRDLPARPGAAVVYRRGP